MIKYVVPFILLSVVGLFVFALTNRASKFEVGDCVIQAHARIKKGEANFIYIEGIDRIQYRIVEYFQKDGNWKAGQSKFIAKSHLEEFGYKEKCDFDIISSLKQEP